MLYPGRMNTLGGWGGEGQDAGRIRRGRAVRWEDKEGKGSTLGG
jgi:hypothetical protein